MKKGSLKMGKNKVRNLSFQKHVNFETETPAKTVHKWRTPNFEIDLQQKRPNSPTQTEDTHHYAQRPNGLRIGYQLPRSPPQTPLHMSLVLHHTGVVTAAAQRDGVDAGRPVQVARLARLNVDQRAKLNAVVIVVVNLRTTRWTVVMTVSIAV